MRAAVLPWLADALVALGLAIFTLAVYGMARLRDPAVQLHVSGKTVFLGALPLLAAAATSGEPAMVSRALLIGVFLALTAPVGGHAMARAMYLRGEARGAGDPTAESTRIPGGPVPGTPPRARSPRR